MKKILLLVFLLSKISLAYSNELFDKLYFAAKSGYSYFDLWKLEKEYKNKEVCSEGYVSNVRVDYFNKSIFIYITIDKEEKLLEDVVIKVTQKDFSWETANNLKKNQKIHFCGNFHSFVGRKIWIQGSVEIYPIDRP